MQIGIVIFFLFLYELMVENKRLWFDLRAFPYMIILQSAARGRL